MTGFTSFGLAEPILKRLEVIEFTQPTPIQQQAIPFAMDGKDILATAQTGTGKTAAFGLPLVQHLMNNPYACALVMTPTRELAVQVMTQIKAFMPDTARIHSALLIGGEAMFKQLKQLQGKPRLIIGTPGRINDHLERDTLRLSKADFLVLDEADRMLDMGFGVQLEAIAKYLPEQRQTLMFSATVPANIMKLASKYLKDPVRVETHQAHKAAPKIKQELIHVNDDTKHDELVKILDARSGQIIVFVKTKHGADRLARKLAKDNHSADTIHGDLRQGQRDRVLRTFRKNEVRILVATDVAARGLDIPFLETVVNYDLPQCPEDYIHRIGRTGRNGEEGEAICLISGHDRSKWAAIDRLMNPGKPREKSEGRSEGGRFQDKKRSSGGRNYGPKSSFGERKFGDKPFAGNRGEGRSEGRADWKSSFKKDEDRKSPHRGEAKVPRRFESHEDPELAQAQAEFLEKKSGEKRSFGKKPFGNKSGNRSEGGFKKDGGFKKEGGFKKDGPRKEWGDRDGAKSFAKPSDGKREGGFKKEWSKDAPKKSWGNKDGAPKKPFTRDAEKPAFKKEGGFKSGGFKSGGFKKDGPRRSYTA